MSGFIETAKWFFPLFILLSAALAAGAYGVNRYTKALRKKQEDEVAARWNTLLLESYERVIENYRTSHTFWHDLKNQYLVIENYLKNKEYDKAEEYMRKLRLTISESLLTHWTNIDVLDILIDCKQKEAQNQGIRMEVLADRVSMKLSEQELVSLFGNLFDNAIEACKRMEEGERWIRIAIRKIREMTFIKVTNPCRERPEMMRNGVLPARRDGRYRGFGISSIKSIVDKHGGGMSMDYNAGEFSVELSFFE